MKMQSTSTLFGIKAAEGEVDGKKYSFTTFYLPAEFGQTGEQKAIGTVTVPYRFGDASEFQKWQHLKNSFPVGGIPVTCEFDVVVGKDAQGKDAPKIALVSIKPIQVAASAKA